jgi:hypothetical protein
VKVEIAKVQVANTANVRVGEPITLNVKKNESPLKKAV